MGASGGRRGRGWWCKRNECAVASPPAPACVVVVYEFGVLVAFNDARQVELNVCWARKAHRVSEQPKLIAVSCDAPERVGVVQVFLYERMRAAALIGGAAVKRLLAAYNVKGRRVRGGARSGIYRIRLPARL